MSSLIERRVRASGHTLWVSDRELDRLHGHVVAGYPHGVVGMLAGDRATGRIARIVPLENERAAPPERRYRVDGLSLMRRERALEAEGLDVLGHYHSHPDHPAMYSDADRDQALPDRSCLIAAVHGPLGPEGDGETTRVTDVRAWRLADDRSEMLCDDLVVLPS
jgi:proteasome lid subunit RPN8/RPN11